MPSLQHVFEKVHIHMACCGGTVTIRKHGTDATDGGERLGRWHTFKALLRSLDSIKVSLQGCDGQQIVHPDSDMTVVIKLRRRKRRFQPF